MLTSRIIANLPPQTRSLWTFLAYTTPNVIQRLAKSKCIQDGDHIIAKRIQGTPPELLHDAVVFKADQNRAHNCDGLDENDYIFDDNTPIEDFDAYPRS